jgi:hypothetical protein
MLGPLLKICLAHLLKMVWILIAQWAIYVKNEDLTPDLTLTPLFVNPSTGQKSRPEKEAHESPQCIVLLAY